MVLVGLHSPSRTPRVRNTGLNCHLDSTIQRQPLALVNVAKRTKVEASCALQRRFYYKNKKFCSTATDVVDCLGELSGHHKKTTKDIFVLPHDSRERQFLTFYNGVLYRRSNT